MNTLLKEMPKSILADIAGDLIRDNGDKIVKSWDVENVTYFEVESKNSYGNPVYSIELEDMAYFIEFKKESITVDTLDDLGEYDVTLNVSTYDKNFKMKDFDSKVLKTYKRKSSAMKFGESLASENNYGFSGFVEHASR